MSQASVPAFAKLSLSYPKPASDVFVRKVVNQEIIDVGEAYYFLEAALCIRIGGSAAQQIILPFVRSNQVSARIDCTFQLCTRKQVTGCMFIGKEKPECTGVVFLPRSCPSENGRGSQDNLLHLDPLQT